MEISENKLKEIMNEQLEEFQHFIGIMKKDIESKMQLIGEHYKGIDGKLGSHVEMIASVAEDIRFIKSDVHFIKGELLGRATGAKIPEKKKVLHHDLDHLAGLWSREEAASLDKTLKAQRKVDAISKLRT